MTRCIFCGWELGRLQRKKLYCGNTNQTVCADCRSKYKDLSAVERAEAAYQTGRAEEAAKLREYLDTVYRAKAEREAAEAAKVARRVSDLRCVRCDSVMHNHGDVTFKLGEESYFFSDLNRLMSGSLTMQLLRCEQCGKVEFFIPDAEELEDISLE